MPDARAPSSEPRYGDVAVSFSGGLDTTLGVVLMLEHFERVHLNIYCNGYCLRAHSPHGRVEQLRNRFGRERIVSTTSATRDLMDRILGAYSTDLRRTGSPLIFDLCCRFGMEIATLLYCLENGISYAADGINCAQPVIFMLEPEYIRMANAFMAEYKVQFLHPVYHFGDRDQRRALLEEHGLNQEVKAISLVQRTGILPQISEQILSQPLCYAQGPIFLLTSPLRNLPILRRFGLPTPQAMAYRDERQVIARELIQERLLAAGIDLADLLARRPEPDDLRSLFPHALE
jgi:hypothetical protein